MSLPCIAGTRIPARQAAFKSHPCRPSAAPRKATPVVMYAVTSSPNNSAKKRLFVAPLEAFCLIPSTVALIHQSVHDTVPSWKKDGILT